jgi:hypothetical protein
VDRSGVVAGNLSSCTGQISSKTFIDCLAQHVVAKFGPALNYMNLFSCNGCSISASCFILLLLRYVAVVATISNADDAECEALPLAPTTVPSSGTMVMWQWLLLSAMPTMQNARLFLSPLRRFPARGRWSCGSGCYYQQCRRCRLRGSSSRPYDGSQLGDDGHVAVVATISNAGDAECEALPLAPTTVPSSGTMVMWQYAQCCCQLRLQTAMPSTTATPMYSYAYEQLLDLGMMEGRWG